MVTTMMKTNLKIMLHALFFMLLAFMTSSPVLSDEHITYVHFDALGSSIAGSDSTGSLVWSEEYQPYGDRIVSDNSTGNNLWYTGKASYENFGLSYFGARWYNPVLGRFTGIDPVKYQEDNIHSFNRYAYANNNPYKFVDPDGRLPVIIIPIIAFIAKELAGEVVEQTTGVQLPTFKNIGKAVFKAGVKKGVAKGAGNGARAGKNHTRGAVKEAKRRNAEVNGGDVVCTTCGVKTTPTTRRTKGSTVNPREGQGDHIFPKSRNGNGATVKDQSNIDIKCASCNNRKSNNL